MSDTKDWLENLLLAKRMLENVAGNLDLYRHAYDILGNDEMAMNMINEIVVIDKAIHLIDMGTGAAVNELVGNSRESAANMLMAALATASRKEM